jgi:2-methylisocitrate lyase-like PEP mutase family enzyme
MRASAKLRALMQQRKTIIAPGCYNALSAKVLDSVGFPALYMTGYGTSLSLLGMPDAGLATMGEMQLNARYIANAVSTPVIADADNGYGNAINVMRTVREYIQTGVAAIHLEDQVMPKRCGHVAGRRVVAIDEAVGKIRAADKVRQDEDPDFVLIAAPTRAAPWAVRWSRRSGAPMPISRPGPMSPSSRARSTPPRWSASAAR